MEFLSQDVKTTIIVFLTLIASVSIFLNLYARQRISVLWDKVNDLEWEYSELVVKHETLSEQHSKNLTKLNNIAEQYNILKNLRTVENAARIERNRNNRQRKKLAAQNK